MNPQNEVSTLLSIIMPPTRLRIWLHTVFEDKQANGKEVPEDFTNWLGVIERICGDGPSDIDGRTKEEWAQVGLAVQKAEAVR